MYYQSVNRGLRFTRAGRYGVGMVFLVGLVAIASGANGLFLFMSFALAGIIVSGILSERSMRQVETRAVTALRCEAEAAFRAVLRVGSTGRYGTAYGIDHQLYLAKPRRLGAPNDPAALGSVRVLSVPAGEEVTAEASCRGLARGSYGELFVVQHTGFPFDLIIKFKVMRIVCDLLVVPQWHPALAELLQRELRDQRRRMNSEGDFRGHRAYVSGDTLRGVHWRKSAGLDPSRWVVKQYEQPIEDWNVTVDGTWDGDLNAVAADYERHLSSVRTAVEVLCRDGRAVALRISERIVAEGLDDALRALAGAPPADRAGDPWMVVNGREGLRSPGVELFVRGESYRWMDGQASVRAGK